MVGFYKTFNKPILVWGNPNQLDLKVDMYGQSIFPLPTIVYGIWEDFQERYLLDNGKEAISKARIFIQEDFPMESWAFNLNNLNQLDYLRAIISIIPTSIKKQLEIVNIINNYFVGLNPDDDHEIKHPENINSAYQFRGKSRTNSLSPYKEYWCKYWLGAQN